MTDPVDPAPPATPPPPNQPTFSVTSDEHRVLMEYRALREIRTLPGLPIEVPEIYASVCTIKASLEQLISKYQPQIQATNGEDTQEEPDPAQESPTD